ncbi:hypothetical protein EBT31_11290 [bacterium]|nr:hypothetical protein [bacterium]
MKQLAYLYTNGVPCAATLVYLDFLLEKGRSTGPSIEEASCEADADAPALDYLDNLGAADGIVCGEWEETEEVGEGDGPSDSPETRDHVYMTSDGYSSSASLHLTGYGEGVVDGRIHGYAYGWADGDPNQDGSGSSLCTERITTGEADVLV